MTQFQSEAVRDFLLRYGPLPAKKISTALVWPPTKTYRVLVSMEARGAVSVKGRVWQAVIPIKEAA